MRRGKDVLVQWRWPRLYELCSRLEEAYFMEESFHFYLTEVRRQLILLPKPHHHPFWSMFRLKKRRSRKTWKLKQTYFLLLQKT